MDHTVNHTQNIRSLYSRAFNFQKKAENSLGNTKMVVKFDVKKKRSGEENGSRLTSVLLERL